MTEAGVVDGLRLGVRAGPVVVWAFGGAACATGGKQSDTNEQ